MRVVAKDRQSRLFLFPKSQGACIESLRFGMAQGFPAYSVDSASYFEPFREESRELRCLALTLLRFWGRTTLKVVIVPSKTNI